MTQATLDKSINGQSPGKCLLQCAVGMSAPINICILIPEKCESCNLDFEFQESDQVTFSVVGPMSVHLSGYFLPIRAGTTHQYVINATHQKEEAVNKTEEEDPNYVIKSVCDAVNMESEMQNSVSEHDSNPTDEGKLTSIDKTEKDDALNQECDNDIKIPNKSHTEKEDDSIPLPTEHNITSMEVDEVAMEENKVDPSLLAIVPYEYIATELVQDRNLETANVEAISLPQNKKRKLETEGNLGDHVDVDAKKFNVQGLEEAFHVEVLQVGKLKGRKASSSKKVEVSYIGKWLGSGQEIESDVDGPSSLSFHLGNEGVMKAWKVALKGRRSGYSARLTIPHPIWKSGNGEMVTVPPPPPNVDDGKNDEGVVYDIKLLKIWKN
ncbi:Peptidyl-prolyl cis-trans isomerase FKBP43 [Linum grandiflorum]